MPSGSADAKKAPLSVMSDVRGKKKMSIIRLVRPTVFLALLGLQGTVWADIFPQHTVDKMCDKADVIIEGTYLGWDTVRIDKSHKTSPMLKKDSRTVEVARLRKHSRTLGYDFRGKGKVIKTKKLVLFLVHRTKTNKWESIATIAAGSCGLFWFDDATCYGYTQPMNPGPYVLFPAGDFARRVPKTVEKLRADIKTGLANSREWRRSLAIEDPSKKAQALARYLLKSTSPKGDKGTYLYAVRKPIAALGKSAVPALIQVLRTAPADRKLDTAVLVLYDIGPPAARAIPELRALLDRPDRAFTGYVLLALGSTGDARAIPDLSKYLKSDNARLAKDAREALQMLRKRRSEQKE